MCQSPQPARRAQREEEEETEGMCRVCVCVCAPHTVGLFIKEQQILSSVCRLEVSKYSLWELEDLRNQANFVRTG